MRSNEWRLVNEYVDSLSYEDSDETAVTDLIKEFPSRSHFNTIVDKWVCLSGSDVVS